jgi:hypothetical protein
VQVRVRCLLHMGDLVWYIPTPLLLLMVVVLVRRQAPRTFPWFFSYCVFGVAADTARFFARSRPSIYPWVYWLTEGGYDIFGIATMYEVVRAVAGTLGRSHWTRLIFPCLSLAALCLSIGRSQAIPSRFGHGLAFYVMVGEIAVRMIQVTVFAGLVTLVPLVGLRWRQYPFGIATGFGLYATVALIMTTKFSDFGTRFTFLWNVTSLVAYSLAVLIWIWFFSVPQKLETRGSEISAPSPGDLKQYKDALRRMR